MKRYLGLDLGTKTLGVSITDRANIMVHPYTLIRFAKEDYDYAALEVKKIIDKENITDIVIGLPKNMDSSLGFASERTLKFIEKLKKFNVDVHTSDERLSTVYAKQILHDNNIKEKDFKDKIDITSAVVILETYKRSIDNGSK